MVCDIPLSPEERRFAEENHDLVYQFLSSNHLSYDDYYDIVVFGYLRAVKRYFSEPNLKQYSFSTTAIRSMRRAYLNHRKMMGSQKRCSDTLNFSDVFSDESPDVPDSTYTFQDLEMQLLLHALAEKVSQQQMTIVRMRTEGYALREIARAQNLSLYFVRKLLEEVRMVLTQLCEE